MEKLNKKLLPISFGAFYVKLNLKAGKEIGSVCRANVLFVD